MFQTTRNFISYWLSACCSRKKKFKLKKSDEQSSNKIQNSKCEKQSKNINQIEKKKLKESSKKKIQNGIDDIKIKENNTISIQSSSKHIEYCEKTMLVFDSGHHTTKSTTYPIEIKTKKCSSANIRSLSPTQPIIIAKKSSTISLNNSLKKLPPISTFFNNNSLQKDSLLQSTKSISSTSISNLSPSLKFSTKFENDRTISSLHKVTNKPATLIIPTFRSQHSHNSVGAIPSNIKEQSNELLRRLTQPNTIPPTISHRIPNRDSASNDSLNLEMCYFKPIKTVPITPSKKGSPVIKRPLPLRIKPKRRKCDVFIGPKKGQMPILFSTLTAFKKCSAFYLNNEKTEIERPTEIPELNLCSLIQKPNITKKNENNNQRNNNLLKRKKNQNKFYIKKCNVVLKRNISDNYLNSERKTKKQLQKQCNRISRRRSNFKNIKSKPSELERKVEEFMKSEINVKKKLTVQRNRSSRNNLVNNKLTNEIVALDESESKSSSSKICHLNRRKNKNDCLGQNNLNPFIETCETNVERKLPKRNTRASNIKQNFHINSKANERIEDINSLNNDDLKITDTKHNDSKINNFSRRYTRNFLHKNNLINTEILSSVVKTKAAVKEIAPEMIFDMSNNTVKTIRKVTKKRDNNEINESNSIDDSIHKNKKIKMESANLTLRSTRQQRRKNKEKNDLLKTDYEFALKLQMELELEAFSIEPVANRTRRLKSRMNLSCDESDHSSSVIIVMNQQSQCDHLNNNYNNNSNNNDNNNNKNNNNDNSNINNKSSNNNISNNSNNNELNETNLSKTSLLNKNKTKLNENQNDIGKKKYLRDRTTKSSKRLLVSLKK